MQAYITAIEYNTITTRAQGEATVARLDRASYLLDARLGVRARVTSGTYAGRKVDLSDTTLETWQTEPVKNWVAWMVAFLYDNDDVLPSGASSVSLGRFSVSNSEAGSESMVYRQLFSLEEQLRDARLIKTAVRSAGDPGDGESV